MVSLDNSQPLLRFEETETFDITEHNWVLLPGNAEEKMSGSDHMESEASGSGASMEGSSVLLQKSKTLLSEVDPHKAYKGLGSDDDESGEQYDDGSYQSSFDDLPKASTSAVRRKSTVKPSKSELPHSLILTKKEQKEESPWLMRRCERRAFPMNSSIRCNQQLPSESKNFML